jgi:DNA repair protein SbcD/Mre11
MIRILHSADWHLGKKLDQHDRAEEHQLFFHWLLKCIEQKKIDILIIAGDIFDTGAPSNESLRMYYDFLVALHKTCCRQVVIIGGNHDSISTLHAPRELLRALQVQVVGGIPDNPEEQIIELKSKEGQTEAVVAAVPFLRDRDVRLSISGESATEREKRMREGIIGHYEKLVPLLEKYRQQGIPMLATGHLFAAGASTSESEKEIHVGTLGHIPANMFPEVFDYIALGHIHRPQTVGGLTHIRYSGSPIPLSFSESNDAKLVVVLEVQKGDPITIHTIPVPCFRPLMRLHGTPEEVLRKAATLTWPTEVALPVWVEVQAHTNNLISHLQENLLEMLQSKPGFGQLFLRQVRLREATGIAEQQTDYLSLTDMSPQHVFDLRLQSLGEEAETKGLQDTFKEALQLMQEKEGAL